MVSLTKLFYLKESGRLTLEEVNNCIKWNLKQKITLLIIKQKCVDAKKAKGFKAELGGAHKLV